MATRRRLANPPVLEEETPLPTQRTRLRSDQLDVEPDIPKGSVARPAAHSSGTANRAAMREEGQHAPPRMRRRRATVVDDPYYIPTDEIPAGSSYEWKRYSVAGQEDPFYIAKMREQGWEPVNPKRHPNWVPPGYSEPHIIKGGQILMERPMELTLEAQAEMRQLARGQIRDAETRLGKAGADEMERDKPKIVKEYMRPVLTAEE